MKPTLVLNARQLVTLAGPKRGRVGAEMADVGVREAWALLLDGDRIAAVGPESDLRAGAGDAQIVDAEGGVVTPGFVDAHTHLVFAGNRVNEFEMRCAGKTYPEIASAGGGIMATVRATRAASDADLVASGTRHAIWMLRCGTTTIEAKSGYGLTLEHELRLLRAARAVGDSGPQRVVATCLGAHAVPPEFEGDRAGYATMVTEDLLPLAAPLCRYVDVFVEDRYFSHDDARRIAARAKLLGLEVRLHVDQLTNNGGAALAAEVGAVTADHLEQTDRTGIAALRAGGVIPVLLPGSVYGLGMSRYPAARAMIEAGLPVVLATDFNPGSSPTPSLPMAMSLACTQMRMTPAEALTACTINAAHSLGLADQIGSLEPGKRADFVVHDIEDWREIAYWFGANAVRAVWVGGLPALSKRA